MVQYGLAFISFDQKTMPPMPLQIQGGNSFAVPPLARIRNRTAKWFWSQTILGLGPLFWWPSQTCTSPLVQIANKSRLYMTLNSLQVLGFNKERPWPTICTDVLQVSNPCIAALTLYLLALPDPLYLAWHKRQTRVFQPALPQCCQSTGASIACLRKIDFVPF